jgi:hypothetical protein
VVTGAYSCHPFLGEYADVRVFCDIDPITQLERIKKRNGEKAVAMFVEKWIPLEEAYINAYQIKVNADLVI